MSFRPEAGDPLVIDGVTCTVAPHPNAPALAYGQEGRQATVYQLSSPYGPRALKVFKSQFRDSSLALQAERLSHFAQLSGLNVCRRTALTPQRHAALISREPDLAFAMLMPWLQGSTWMEIVQDRRALGRQRSLDYTRALSASLAGMETRGLAHCDLSSPNLILADAPIQSVGVVIELVDVEQMFGPGLSRPSALPAGSAGYAHPVASSGYWSADGDRFAGAILLAEILGSCDERVCDMAWGESYFEPGEMQRECERYQLLGNSIAQRWGRDVATLLARAWTARTLAECPALMQWHQAVSQLTQAAQPASSRATPHAPGPSTPAAPAVGFGPAAGMASQTEDDAEAVRQLGHRLIRQGDTAVGLAALRQAYRAASPTGELRKTLAVEILQAEDGQSRGASPPPFGAQPAGTLRPPPGLGYQPTGQATAGHLANRSPSSPPIQRWQPAKAQTRGSTLLLYSMGFGITALLCYLLLLAFKDSAWSARDALVNSGEVANQSVGAMIIALPIGLLQILIFRSRLSLQQAVLFVLSTEVGALLGGALAGGMISGGSLTKPGAGWVIGAVAGGVGAAGQVLSMRNHGAAWAWGAWGTMSFSVAFGSGWLITRLINGTTGIATGALLVIALAGLGQIGFLLLFPEVEF